MRVSDSLCRSGQESSTQSYGNFGLVARHPVAGASNGYAATTTQRWHGAAAGHILRRPAPSRNDSPRGACASEPLATPDRWHGLPPVTSTGALAPRIRGPSAAAALPRQRIAATKRRGTSQSSAVGHSLTMRMLCDALTSRASMLPSGRPAFMPVLEKGGEAGATSSQSPCACHASLTPDLHTLTPATFRHRLSNRGLAGVVRRAKERVPVSALPMRACVPWLPRGNT